MKPIALLSLLLLLLVMTVKGQQSAPADLILHNGVIWTVDKNNSTAQAVAIKDGKFIAVGSNATALKLRGPATCHRLARPFRRSRLQRQSRPFRVCCAVSRVQHHACIDAGPVCRARERRDLAAAER